MEIANGRRLALALAVLAALAWAARYAGRQETPPVPAQPAAVPAAPVPLKAKATPRKRIVRAVETPAEPRGAGLRDKGEALGGRAPDRADR